VEKEKVTTREKGKAEEERTATAEKAEKVTREKAVGRGATLIKRRP
jgi:hypothetical protein